jgi:hypothetical protein
LSWYEALPWGPVGGTEQDICPLRIKRTKMKEQEYTNINTKDVILPLNTINGSVRIITIA